MWTRVHNFVNACLTQDFSNFLYISHFEGHITEEVSLPHKNCTQKYSNLVLADTSNQNREKGDLVDWF